MRVKGHCPNCGPDKWAQVEADYHDKWEDEHDGYPIWGDDQHRILRCGGCDRIYFQTLGIFSEDDPNGGPTITHWPPPRRRNRPRWYMQLLPVDYVLFRIVSETYDALDTDLRTLSAIGMRTIFDRSSQLLGVNPELSFERKLDELVGLGKIGNDERASLVTLTNAGSAAVHRAWSPTQDHLDTMIEIIEGFLHRSFFVQAAAKDLAAHVPVRQKE